MLRSGLSASSKSLLSRRCPSSRNSNQHAVDLLRHFASADFVSTSNDEHRSNNKSQYKPQSFKAGSMITSSGMIGTSSLLHNAQNSFHLHDNFTVAKRTFFSRSKKSKESNEDTATESDFSTDTTNAVPATEENIGSTPVSAEEAMAKFEENASAVDAATETAVAVADAANVWEPTWWPQDQMIQLVCNIHDATGYNYALTIGGLTLAFRSLMFPLFVKAQRNSSRMAHMKPEMDVIKAKVDRLDKSDMAGQQVLAQEFQALYRKYDVNPLRAIALPFLQMPVFVSMFFGMREMPNIYPEKLADGGMLWFTDLTAADPTYALPIGCAVSFLLMMELGKEQMMSSNPAQAKMMLTFFRSVAVLMVPLTYTFPTSVLCYWTANNTFSLFQSALFRSKTVRKSFGIWDPPKPVPGAAPAKGMMDMMNDYMAENKKSNADTRAKEKIELHNAAIDKKMMGKAGRRKKK